MTIFCCQKSFCPFSRKLVVSQQADTARVAPILLFQSGPLLVLVLGSCNSFGLHLLRDVSVVLATKCYTEEKTDYIFEVRPGVNHTITIASGYNETDTFDLHYFHCYMLFAVFQILEEIQAYIKHYFVFLLMLLGIEPSALHIQASIVLLSYVSNLSYTFKLLILFVFSIDL